MKDIIKIIQISDTHLFADDEMKMFDIKSNHNFEAVLSKIKAEEIHDTDFIFLTGDVSQDETRESYEHIANALSALNIPIYWIPGNHDNFIQMGQVLNSTQHFHFERTLSLANWEFIFLNSAVAGRGDGELIEKELNDLSAVLASIPQEKKVVILMHHHPISVSSPLMDSYILKNADAFWAIIENTPTSLIICGHVHGDYHLTQHHIAMESGPASCFQIVKGVQTLEIDKRVGYKVYHFAKDQYNAIAKLWAL